MDDLNFTICNSWFNSFLVSSDTLWRRWILYQFGVIYIMCKTVINFFLSLCSLNYPITFWEKKKTNFDKTLAHVLMLWQQWQCKKSGLFLQAVRYNLSSKMYTLTNFKIKNQLFLLLSNQRFLHNDSIHIKFLYSLE